VPEAICRANLVNVAVESQIRASASDEVMPLRGLEVHALWEGGLKATAFSYANDARGWCEAESVGALRMQSVQDRTSRTGFAIVAIVMKRRHSRAAIFVFSGNNDRARSTQRSKRMRSIIRRRLDAAIFRLP
jgi:hypothetical protein